MNIQDIVAFEYAKTAETIYNLKGQAFQAALVQGYGYYAPNALVGTKSKPAEFNLQEGWRFGRTSLEHVVSHMSPKHRLWKEYCWTRARARIINCAILMLKRDGDLTSQARLPSQQRRLAKKAKAYLKKIENRLDKHPGQYSGVSVWLTERSAERAARAAA